MRLWGKAAGRCEYRGCRKPLWLDSLTKAEFNTAYIAHIYGIFDWLDAAENFVDEVVHSPSEELERPLTLALGKSVADVAIRKYAAMRCGGAAVHRAERHFASRAATGT